MLKKKQKNPKPRRPYKQFNHTKNQTKNNNIFSNPAKEANKQMGQLQSPATQLPKSL